MAQVALSESSQAKAQSLCLLRADCVWRKNDYQLCVVSAALWPVQSTLWRTSATFQLEWQLLKSPERSCALTCFMRSPFPFPFPFRCLPVRPACPAIRVSCCLSLCLTLSLSLSLYLPVSLSLCLCVSLSLCLYVSLSLCLCVCPSLPLSLSASLPLPLPLPLFVCLPACLPACLSICLSACLSFSPSVRPLPSL